MLKESGLRCALVSIAFAALVPLISSTIVVAGTGGDVIDPGAIENYQTGNEFGQDVPIVDSMPTRKLQGLEKFTHQFAHPQFLRYYLRGVVASFVWFFLATLTVSYLGQRVRNNA